MKALGQPDTSPMNADHQGILKRATGHFLPQGRFQFVQVAFRPIELNHAQTPWFAVWESHVSRMSAAAI